MPTGNSSLTKIFQKFIPSNIAKSQTSVFWNLFNGTDAALAQFEVILKFFRKENNMLTANQIGSLRTLAAGNGFEPSMKIPANGTVSIALQPKLFNRVGYPVYIPPYAEFTEQVSGLKYYYDSNTVVRVGNDTTLIPLTEGTIGTQTQVSSGSLVERYYIPSANVADGSIVVMVGTQAYQQVKSFSDNSNINGGFLFIAKFSNMPNNPIVIYVMGTTLNDNVTINWKTTVGEAGNLQQGANFVTTDMLTAQGLEVNPSADEATMLPVNGFTMGSNGTDENSLRAAIGFNHGVTLLFDTVSYTAFIAKFSTMLLQKVTPNTTTKQISNIYLSLKTWLDPNSTLSLQDQYQNIIAGGTWLLPAPQKTLLDNLITQNEFALSSHNLFDPQTNNYALQIMFNSNDDKVAQSGNISNAIYTAFSQFLWNGSWSINLELLFNDFMTTNNVNFAWTLFNQSIEATKISSKVQGPNTPYVLSALDGVMPVLNGNFPIADQNFAAVQLFFDINIVSQDELI
jgi:hypothetical protein